MKIFTNKCLKLLAIIWIISNYNKDNYTWYSSVLIDDRFNGKDTYN